MFFGDLTCGLALNLHFTKCVNQIQKQPFMDFWKCPPPLQNVQKCPVFYVKDLGEKTVSERAFLKERLPFMMMRAPEIDKMSHNVLTVIILFAKDSEYLPKVFY